MLLLVCTTLAVVVGALFIQHVIKVYHISHKLLGHIPGETWYWMPYINPFADPLARNLFKRHLHYDRVIDEYGQGKNVVKLVRGGELGHLLVSSKKDLKHVLHKNAKNYPKGNIMTPMERIYFGANILTSNDNDVWRRHRSIAGAALSHSSFLQDLVDVVKEQVDLMMSTDQWKRSKDVNISNMMKNLTLNVIGLAGFGFDFLQFEDSDESRRRRDMMDTAARAAIFTFFMPSIYWSLPFGLPKKAKQAQNDFRELVTGLINKKRNQQDNSDIDLLYLMIKKKEELGTEISETELISNASILVFAGAETSSNTLIFVFRELSRHLDYQKLIQDQIDEVCGTEYPRYDQFNKLTRLESFIKETLRMYTIATAATKQSIHSDTLPSGVFVPANCSIEVNLRKLHRSKEIYGADADQFKPDRYLNNDFSAYDWLPFSSGKRDCVGRRFAMTEMMYALARILQQCTVTMKEQDCENLEEMCHLTLGYNRDVIVQLQPRS